MSEKNLYGNFAPNGICFGARAMKKLAIKVLRKATSRREWHPAASSGVADWLTRIIGALLDCLQPGRRLIF